MTQMKKGFTLIELLVVIAIIGILSAVVLTSLNSARSKANDAKVKAQLNNVRAAAELYYDSNNGSYSGVFATSTVAQLLTTANLPAAVVVSTTSAPTQSYMVTASLPSGGFWCVDSAGNSKSAPSQTAASATVCP